MKGQLRVATPEQYIAQLEEPRRTEIERLDTLIRKTVPKLERCICAGMLAYGPIHYRYASGREGDSARLSVASNAAAISLYAFGADERGWIAERYKDRFPKAKIGKSCVRFKRLDDLDLAALRALLREVAKSPFPSHGGETQAKVAARASAKTAKRKASVRKKRKP